MPYPAARVGRVAVVARDHVDVRMEDRLPGAAPAVEPDVDAGWMVPVQQILPNPLHQLPAGSLLIRMHLEVLGHVPPRDHQGVPFRHRIRIRDGERQAVFNDLRGCRSTKRASGRTAGRVADWIADRRRFLWCGSGFAHIPRYTIAPQKSQKPVFCLQITSPHSEIYRFSINTNTDIQAHLCPMNNKQTLLRSTLTQIWNTKLDFLFCWSVSKHRYLFIY